MTGAGAVRGERAALLRRVLLWLGGSAVGVLLVALPDRDDRVFSISDDHGPSAVDLVGVAVLVAVWLPFVGALWSRRRALPPPFRRTIAVLVVAGAAWLVVTIATDAGAWWVLGVAALLAAQLLALGYAWRAGGLRDRGVPSPSP